MTIFKALLKSAKQAGLSFFRPTREAVFTVEKMKAGPALLSALLVIVAALVLAAPALAGEFGLQSASVKALNESGTPGHGAADLQAGSHPFELVTSFVLNEPEPIPGNNSNEVRDSGGDLKDVRVELPPGFVGDPSATPKCTYPEFIKETESGQQGCPNETVVGYALTYLSFINPGEYNYQYSPVYNMEAPPGVPAQFAFTVHGAANVFLDASVRTGSDYGLTINVSNLGQVGKIYANTVTIWGVPAAASHNPYRGRGCLGDYAGEEVRGKEQFEEVQTQPPPSTGECPVNVPVLPLLDNPTSCSVPRAGSLSVDSWQNPGHFVTDPISLPELGGCEKLDFSPTLGVTPDGTDGSTPTGLNVEQSVPQQSVLNPEGLAESDVKNTTVTLPAGVQLDPSAADGLQACTGNPADPPGTPGNEIGFTGSNPQSGADEFTPRKLGSLAATLAGELALLQPGVNFCPDASKVATVRIKTPLLEEELEGSVYLAAPQNFAGGPLENPFGSLLALYLVAEDPQRGVLVKVAGKVVPNPETGQLTTTFENTPQLPYSSLKLEFYGTDRAPLATPGLCGSYSSQASLEPWSAPPGGTSSSAVSLNPDFQIASGPGGSACSDPLPFSPTLQSGVTNIQAGAFSPLDTTFSREDGQQSLSSVQLHYPAGVSGILTGVPLCGEAEANAGTCSEASKIGETIVSVGLGNDPFSVTGGKVYLTGPYEGAPFGLSIVNPAKAGPFDLQEGRPVIVRAKIEINPITAALTVTTNTEAQGNAIPHIIDGIPLQIKHVYVNVNRPGFTFNPTSCNPTKVTGTINSAEGSTSPVEIPFQVTNCAQLKFSPHFEVSTSGKTSKADGASLTYRISYPNVPQGTDANISYAKVELPSELPSRLTTLQKACTSAQFDSNPASCPAESVIGHAKVHTQLLPVPLEGPVYFVSNGGEAFPNLIMVLQGDGVTIDLVGDTLIKNGVTSTTFKAVPDQPFQTFEINLPEGPYSALAANSNLCKPTVTKTVKQKQRLQVNGKMRTVTRKLKEQVPTTLTIPSDYVGQNGATYSANLPIKVEGCGKVKAKPAVKKHKKKAKGKGHKK